MLRFLLYVLPVFLALGTSCVRAQGADPADLAFWRSIQGSTNPAEYKAYLEAFPNGRFVPLARLRAAHPRPGSQSASPAEPQSSGASIRVARPSVRLIDGITVDVDALALRSSSNLRLAVMAADAPDAIADPDAFMLESTPIEAARIRLTLPGGPVGRGEVRLYHVPQFGSSFTVAARAPVTVQPGISGATLSRDLVREAVRLGPVRFEANHRDQPLLVQAQFLRLRPDTEWNLAWVGGLPAGVTSRDVVLLSIGQVGVTADASGSKGEILCLVSAETKASLRRIAALTAGDALLVRGIPTTWNSATARDPVLLKNCGFAD